MCALVLAGRSVGQANSHVCERKCPPVGEFGDPFIGRPIGVRCLRLDSNEHRLVASLRRLERRGELERMARDDTIVMIRCCDERCRIARAGRYVVQRRVVPTKNPIGTVMPVWCSSIESSLPSRSQAERRSRPR